jgi:hypothetical protein
MRQNLSTINSNLQRLETIVTKPGNSGGFTWPGQSLRPGADSFSQMTIKTKSFSGLLAPIPQQIILLPTQSASRKPGIGSSKRKIIRDGRRLPAHFSGFMAFLVVVKPSCGKAYSAFVVNLRLRTLIQFNNHRNHQFVLCSRVRPRHCILLLLLQRYGEAEDS